MANAVVKSAGGRWRDSRVMRVLQRVVLILVLLYAAVGAWAVYRSWVQVRTLELHVVSDNVRPGIPALVEVVTSGVTTVDVKLELVQGDRRETLSTLRIVPARQAFFNPRIRQGTMMPSFSPEFLAHFRPGPAIVRATATGRRKWLMTPSPVVKEVPVVIAAPSN
ncbi:MAG: hypothetical protein ACREN6_00940 [Gemmatimonadaceae bacterium]